ncbi:MAG: hypothetical protein KDE46_29485, partial [Caldilineaceae bacterium]|nr:hypothetical protein [Caldilineaceae bacterium]
YIARRMANGEAGQRVFLCTLPVGAHLLPMQSAHHIFLAVPTAAAPAWESCPLQANALALWQMALAQAPCTAAQGRREQAVRIVQAEKSFRLDAQEAITARAPLWILSEEPAFAFADSSAEAAQNTGHYSASLPPVAVAPLGRGWVIHTTSAAGATVVTPDDFLAHAADDVVMQVATAWAQQAAAWLDTQLQQTGEAVRQSRRQAAANYESALANVARSATGISPATRQAAARDPLTAALRLLGQRQGFTIQLEEQKEPQADPERQLAQLAQIAGFRYRRVTLSDDWQHEAGLPLLGFCAEGQPLVLLPERLGYVALDPVTNVRLPVDADVAALLAPQAYQLYASLPDRLNARTLIRFVLRGGWSNIGWMLIGAFMVMLLGLVTPIVM